MWKETFLLRLWAFRHIPLLAWIRPSVIELSSTRCVIRLRLGRRTRNHLGSMYFAALCAGADAAAALPGLAAARKAGGTWSIIFKDVSAFFHKRAEGNVHFVFTQGEELAQMLRRAAQTGERQNLEIRIAALVPDKLGAEPAADFTLTLSARKRA